MAASNMCGLGAIAAITGALALTPLARSAALVASYGMNDTLAADQAGVPALLAVDPLLLSGFRTEAVFGQNRRVYRFDGAIAPAQQAGLVFDSAGRLDPYNYSMELVFSLDLQSGWRRIVDVLGRSADSGFYVDPSSRLAVYPVTAGTTTFTAPAYHHVVFTVADPDGAGVGASTNVKGYLDGHLEFTATTSVVVINAAQQLALFLDNNQGSAQQEYSDGSVAVARFYQGALTDAEVLGLYQQFVAPPTLTGDLNHDCAVNTLDLVILLQHFGVAALPDQGDLNGDGVVNTLDLIALLGAFGRTCA